MQRSHLLGNVLVPTGTGGAAVHPTARAIALADAAARNSRVIASPRRPSREEAVQFVPDRDGPFNAGTRS